MLVFNSLNFISKPSLQIFFKHQCFRSQHITQKYIKKSQFLSNLIIKRFISEEKHDKLVKGLLPAEDTTPKERVFKEIKVKDKNSFLKIIEVYNEKGGMKRGHIQFIFAALRAMEEFNLQDDLEVYKKLMNIFPKGKMVVKNMWQAEMEHFPRHQDCAIDILDQMEYNAVCPDKEIKELIINIFGKSSVVFKKYGRMNYWMPKLKNKNPYLLYGTLPNDTEELARLALQKMSVDLRTKITHFKSEELESAIDKTWIVSAQSPVQQKLLVDHPIDNPLYVEGSYLVWMRRLSLSYFILRSDPILRKEIEVDDDDVSNIPLYLCGEPKPPELTIAPQTVHEQKDETILAMCATGTSSKDSVVSWIYFLRKTNPILDKIPILFKLRSAPTSLTTLNAPFVKYESSEISKEKSL